MKGSSGSGKVIACLLLLLGFYGIPAGLQAQDRLPNTLLWRINAKNGGKPSYLYGTIHLTDQGKRYIFYKMRQDTDSDYTLVGVGPFPLENSTIDIDNLTVRSDSGIFNPSKLTEKMGTLIKRLNDK